jgi:hypothetical protein
MQRGLSRWLAGAGLSLVLGCGGKAVTTGDSASTRSSGSGGSDPGSGGTGVDGSGGDIGRNTATGGTGAGGPMRPPDEPPPMRPPDEPPPMRPPDEPPPVPPPDEPPSIPGDCTAGSRTVEQDWCQVDLQCDGRFASTWCEADGETAYCYCEGDRYYGDFVVRGVSGAEACDTVGPYCVGGQPNLGEVMCEPTYQEGGGQYCSSEAECTRVVDLGDDVTLEVRDWRYVFCEQNGSAWTCDCNSNTESVRFDFDGATSNICSDALDLCIGGEIDTSGPKECAPNYQSASQNYCDAGLDCTQEGSLGGVAVRVHSNVRMSCQSVDAGAWRCDCYLDSGTVSFAVDGDDAWSTCQTGSTLCAEAASY